MSKTTARPRSSVEADRPIRAGVVETRRERAPRAQARTRDTIFGASLVLLDATLILLALLLAYRITPGMPAPDGRALLTLAVTGGTLLAVFSLGRLYRQGRVVSRVDQLYQVCVHVSLGLVVALALSTFLLGPNQLFSRQLMLLAWLLTVGLVTAGRLAHGFTISRLRLRGVAVDRLLIVGTGATGRIVLDKLVRTPELGYEVVGFLAHPATDGAAPASVEGVPVHGTTERLAPVIRRHRVDELILALDGTPRDQVLDLVYQVVDLPVSIKVYPDTFRLITNDELSIGDLGGLPMITLRTIGLRAGSRIVKRLMDVAISGTALVLLSPLMLLLALLVKLSSPGPVLYAQERVGHDGRTFRLLKFRSMPVDAEAETGPVWARRDDPRPTRLGRLLRRYSLDELPQLVNVLKGDMSLVGPRPERPCFVERFSQTIPSYALRHREKSGITGWAQVNGLRGDTSIEERTRYDLYYVENWSPIFDLKILAKTLIRIFDDDSAC